MLRSVHYGGYEFKPWTAGPGFVDLESKSLKSFRSREPATIWQSLSTDNDCLGEYDLYVCSKCLLYTSTPQQLATHEKMCKFDITEIGKVVYRDEDYIFYELQTPLTTNEYNPVKLYLQCLSLFGHLFLQTKSICFTTSSFVYYIAFHKQQQLVAGFFSKELESWHNYNLACIITFPPFQKTGLGHKMIRFSYWLSSMQSKYGSPERPLSKFGLISYQKFWRTQIKLAIAKKAAVNKSQQKVTMSLNELAKETGIDPQDLATVLNIKNGKASLAGNSRGGGP